MVRRKKTLFAPIIAIVVSAVVGILFISMLNTKKSVAVVPQEPPKTIIKRAPTVKILTAKDDIPIGTKISAEHFMWRTWPESLLSPDYITKNDKPEIINNLHGGIVKIPILKGEPIIANKIISPGERGAMAILLRKGMRAISVPISEITGAGGFILPGDRVDVLYTASVIRDNLLKSEIIPNNKNSRVKEAALKSYIDLKKQNLSSSATDTRKNQDNPNTNVDNSLVEQIANEKELLVANNSQFTEVMLENVRILAIAQSLNKQSKNPNSGSNEKQQDSSSMLGASATLEVTPEQAKLLAWSVSSGKLTLSLRAFEAIDPNNDNSLPVTKTSFAWPLEQLLNDNQEVSSNNGNKLQIFRNNRVSSITPNNPTVKQDNQNEGQNNKVSTDVIR